ncbi:hypothetical protein BT96DRAFT_212624 [Gymnopus androsaceus JB14]|uniref:Uncharacterized protein n=1 Tax=Gymnopus androsaceus JB14 TaxID=1447944 RepID=A0A6A4H9A5_9AGAR|nr:hypothetical protein BT96DRAFT_212624 [Gymnopus androsaceus JB14]
MSGIVKPSCERTTSVSVDAPLSLGVGAGGRGTAAGAGDGASTLESEEAAGEALGIALKERPAGQGGIRPASVFKLGMQAKRTSAPAVRAWPVTRRYQRPATIQIHRQEWVAWIAGAGVESQRPGQALVAHHYAVCKMVSPMLKLTLMWRMGMGTNGKYVISGMGLGIRVRGRLHLIGDTG